MVKNGMKLGMKMGTCKEWYENGTCKGFPPYNWVSLAYTKNNAYNKLRLKNIF